MKEAIAVARDVLEKALVEFGPAPADEIGSTIGTIAIRCAAAARLAAIREIRAWARRTRTPAISATYFTALEELLSLLDEMERG